MRENERKRRRKRKKMREKERKICPWSIKKSAFNTKKTNYIGRNAQNLKKLLYL